MRISVFILVLMSYTIIVCGEDTKYRLQTKEEVREQFKLKAIRTILQALEYSDFATALECPCYDVRISSDVGYVLIKIDNDSCNIKKEEK